MADSSDVKSMAAAALLMLAVRRRMVPQVDLMLVRGRGFHFNLSATCRLAPRANALALGSFVSMALPDELDKVADNVARHLARQLAEVFIQVPAPAGEVVVDE